MICIDSRVWSRTFLATCFGKLCPLSKVYDQTEICFNSYCAIDLLQHNLAHDSGMFFGDLNSSHFKQENVYELFFFYTRNAVRTVEK